MGNAFYERYLQSEAWLRRRDRELARAGDCCEFCGGGECEPLQVHHLSYEHLGQELPGELIVLCKSCHADVHEYPKIDAAVRQIANAAAEQQQRMLIEREQGMRAARAILAGLETGSSIGEPELGEGYCMDCGKRAHWRWTLVNKRCGLALCRLCRSSRKAVAIKLGIDTVEDDEWGCEEPAVEVLA